MRRSRTASAVPYYIRWAGRPLRWRIPPTERSKGLFVFSGTTGFFFFCGRFAGDHHADVVLRPAPRIPRQSHKRHRRQPFPRHLQHPRGRRTFNGDREPAASEARVVSVFPSGNQVVG